MYELNGNSLFQKLLEDTESYGYDLHIADLYRSIPDYSLRAVPKDGNREEVYLCRFQSATDYPDLQDAAWRWEQAKKEGKVPPKTTKK